MSCNVIMQFDEAHSVIARYDTLHATREVQCRLLASPHPTPSYCTPIPFQDLMSTEHNSQDAIEIERAGLLKFVEDKSNEILSYNNELAHLQTELEEVQARVMKW